MVGLSIEQHWPCFNRIGVFLSSLVERERDRRSGIRVLDLIGDQEGAVAGVE